MTHFTSGLHCPNEGAALTRKTPEGRLHEDRTGVTDEALYPRAGAGG